MLIRSYGLFWRRDKVYWGKPRSTGHLKGVFVRKKRSEAVDFRDQQGVYVLYDDDFKLVYVGQAGKGQGSRLFARLKQHREDSLADRWSRFSWFGTRSVNKDGTLKAEVAVKTTSPAQILDHIEAILISSSEPPLNLQGGKFGSETRQYRQYRDDELLGMTEEMMIKQIWQKVSALNAAASRIS